MLLRHKTPYQRPHSQFDAVQSTSPPMPRNVAGDLTHLFWFAEWLLPCCFLITVRCAIALSPHSGQASPPMFGDYEAQRHWMEITIHTPISDWYRQTPLNNLLYWGLDYPPLTAYHSYIIGLIFHRFERQAVALSTSHGYESDSSKWFMRMSVLISDLLIYFVAVFMLMFMVNKEENQQQLQEHTQEQEKKKRRDTQSHRPQQLAHQSPAHSSSVIVRKTTVWLLLFFPALILIDHGHFQYNCVSLGLYLMAIAMFRCDHDVPASILFCLALSFKQLLLYYAPVIASYLIGKSIRKSRAFGSLAAFAYLTKLACSVAATFFLVFSPWIVGNPKQAFADLCQILHRIFPFARGIFEDKVANIWCSLGLVFKWNKLFSISKMSLICATCTLLASSPFMLLIAARPTAKMLAIASAGSALVFYLLGFQVHEKQILLPLLPLQLVAETAFDRHAHGSEFLVIVWASVLGCYSMIPLLFREGQALVFIALIVLYVGAMWAINVYVRQALETNTAPPLFTNSIPSFFHVAFLLSCAGMITILALYLKAPKIQRLPDFYVYLITIYSCFHFCLLYFYLLYLGIASLRSEMHLKNVKVD